MDNQDKILIDSLRIQFDEEFNHILYRPIRIVWEHVPEESHFARAKISYNMQQKKLNCTIEFNTALKLHDMGLLEKYNSLQYIIAHEFGHLYNALTWKIEDILNCPIFREYSDPVGEILAKERWEYLAHKWACNYLNLSFEFPYYSPGT